MPTTADIGFRAFSDSPNGILRESALALQGIQLSDRGLEYQKAGGLMSMAQNRLGAANQARQAATASIMGGIGALGAGAGAEFGDDQ